MFDKYDRRKYLKCYKNFNFVHIQMNFEIKKGITSTTSNLTSNKSIIKMNHLMIQDQRWISF